jgi:hypothetical protein
LEGVLPAFWSRRHVRNALKRDQAAALDVLDDELAETKRAKRRRRETEGARR